MHRCERNGEIEVGAAYCANITNYAGKMVNFNVWKQQEENAF
jgi:hypothetical protein